MALAPPPKYTSLETLPQDLGKQSKKNLIKEALLS
jgi:hypothetical protein